MITFHLLLAREHGAAVAEPLLVSYDDPLPLFREYERVTGADCAEFAKTYAELLFIRDTSEVAHHEFPDPALAAERRQRDLLAEARGVRDAAAAAKAGIEEAKVRAAAAQAELKNLSDEHLELLKADDDAARQAAAEAKAATAAAVAAQDRAEADAQAAADLAAEEQAQADAAAAATTAATAAVTVADPAPAAEPAPVPPM